MKIPQLKLLPIVPSLAVLFLLYPHRAQASDTWNAATSGLWETGGNWSSGVPASSDDVVIDVGSATPYTVTTGTGAITINTLNLGEHGSTPTLEINSTLFQTTNQGGDPFLIGGFGGTGNLIVNNGATFQSASSLQQYTGTITVNQGGAIQFNVAKNNQPFLVNGTVIDHGTINAHNSNGYLNIDGTGSFTVDGSTAIAHFGSLIIQNHSATVHLNVTNGGSFSVDANANGTIMAANHGVANISVSSGSFTNNGTLQVAYNGGNVNLAGTNNINLTGGMFTSNGLAHLGGTNVTDSDISNLNVDGGSAAFNAGLILGATSNIEFGLNTNLALKVINGAGSVTYGGTLTVNFSGSNIDPGNYTLFGGLTYDGASTFSSITVNGLSGGETSSFDYSTGTLRVVPEPGTVALLMSSLLVVFLGRKMVIGRGRNLA